MDKKCKAERTVVTPERVYSRYQATVKSPSSSYCNGGGEGPPGPEGPAGPAGPAGPEGPAGPAGGQSAVLFWGEKALTLPAAETHYLSPGYEDRVAPASPPAIASALVIPVISGRLHRLAVRHNVSGIADPATTTTYYLVKNGLASALSVSLNVNTGVQAIDLVNSEPVVLGDRVSIQVIKSGNLTSSPEQIVASVELGPP